MRVPQTLYVIYATLKFIGGGENQNKEKKMSLDNGDLL
jgi:hypothetical protein